MTHKPVTISLPEDLGDEVREYAFRNRKPIKSVYARAITLGLAAMMTVEHEPKTGGQ